jgi:hypothetical protein
MGPSGRSAGSGGVVGFRFVLLISANVKVSEEKGEKQHFGEDGLGVRRGRCTVGAPVHNDDRRAATKSRKSKKALVAPAKSTQVVLQSASISLLKTHAGACRFDP